MYDPNSSVKSWPKEAVRQKYKKIPRHKEIRTDILGHDHIDIKDYCIRGAKDASDSRAEAPQEAGEVSKPEVLVAACCGSAE